MQAVGAIQHAHQYANSTKGPNCYNISKGGQRGHSVQRDWDFNELMATNEQRSNDYIYILHLAGTYDDALQLKGYKRQN